jgi:uncharacterized protein YjbI with pentapeptide repeats
MANPEHLQILKEGVTAWNAWRNQNENITPDLTQADLTQADLTQADLRGANLNAAYLDGANLSGADLSSACLTFTVFSGANLSGAEFKFANLSGAYLDGANLSGARFFCSDLTFARLKFANLSGAELIFAHLSDADLTGADVSQMSLDCVDFGNTNLTAVQGLETCQHNAPSTLDHRTLVRNKQLPLIFLRGCGLPDRLIDYIPSLLNEPFQFYSCFISYASKDHAFAERLHADLQNKGVRCWFAPEDLKIGDRFRPRIDETIRVYDKLLLVLSRRSMASQWVEQEVETALARERQQGTTILFPVKIDNTVMTLETGWPALIRNTRNIGDFRRWKTHNVYQKAFDRLLRDLNAAERKPAG